MYHLVLAGVDVGKHAQFFEALGRQVLRLVEDQHDAPARGVFVDQIVLQLLEELHVAHVRVETDAERVQDPLDQFAPPALGVGNEPDCDLVSKLAQKFPEERGLPATDAPGDKRDRCAAEDAELQHRIGAPVLRRPEQEIRIRDERERTLAEPEEVHVEADAALVVRCWLHGLVHPQSTSHAAGHLPDTRPPRINLPRSARNLAGQMVT